MSRSNKVTRKIGGSTPVVLTPPTFNRIISVTDLVEGRQNDRLSSPRAPRTFGNRERQVKNVSGEDIQEGRCLRASGIVMEPDPSSNGTVREFFSKWVYEGDLPDNDGEIDRDPLMLTKEFIPDGQTGLCVLSGDAPCWADLTDVDNLTVGVDYQGTGGEILKGDIPGFPILWMDRSVGFVAGPQWCLVETGPAYLRLGSIKIIAPTGIPARTGADPGTPGSKSDIDFYHLDNTTGAYVLWREDQTVHNWSKSAFTSGAHGWAAQDFAGVWHCANEEC